MLKPVLPARHWTKFCQKMTPRNAGNSSKRNQSRAVDMRGQGDALQLFDIFPPVGGHAPLLLGRPVKSPGPEFTTDQKFPW